MTTTVVYGIDAVIEPQRRLIAAISPVLELTAVIRPLTDPASLEELVPSTVSYRVIVGDELLATDPDPHYVDVTSVSDDTLWRIMHAKVVTLPANAIADKVDVTLLWRTVMLGAGHTGNTKWALSRESETVGQAPIEAIDLTPSFASSDVLTQHSASGTSPQAALGVGAFTLMLLGKAGAAAQQIDAAVLDESDATVTIY